MVFHDVKGKSFHQQIFTFYSCAENVMTQTHMVAEIKHDAGKNSEELKKGARSEPSTLTRPSEVVTVSRSSLVL